MTNLQLRILVLCISIFALLIVFAIFIIWYFIKLLTKSIKNGAEDEILKKEYKKKEVSKPKLKKIFNIISYFILCAIFITLFIFTLIPKLTCDGNKINTSTAVVVKSTSMAEKNKNNSYLFDNNLNNQFDMFDIIFISKLPKEADLKLYDIVVYTLDNTWVVHRIVKIEEPNSNHPNKRIFTLQGDAVDNPDYKSVTYDQMSAIYSGKKIPFIGSIVMFAQSVPGIMCIVAIISFFVINPLLIRKIENESINRLIEIGYLPKSYKEDKNKKNTKKKNKNIKNTDQVDEKPEKTN